MVVFAEVFMDRDMKVAIIGAGAVGLGIGAGLAANGVAVRFVTNRREQCEALSVQGITRTGVFGDIHAPPASFEASDSLDDLPRDPADYWLVCVKGTESESLARSLGEVWRMHDSPPPVVLCQNGWGNAEIFSRYLPKESVFNGRVITGFEREGAAAVCVTVHADAIHIGSLFGADTEPLQPLCAEITKGGVPCEVSDEIAKDLWAKVLYNGLLNPLGALVDVPYGALGERKETRAIMEAIAREIYTVMHGAGFASHWATADNYLETFYEKLLPPTAEHESSMLQDLRAGRRTEIDFLCGAVCEIAAENGIDAPINRALLDLIHAAEQRTVS